MKFMVILFGVALGFSGFSARAFAQDQKEDSMSALEMGFFALPVSDMAVAKKFYGSVMGWDFNDRDPKFSYIMAGGKMIGALEAASDSFKPSSSGPLLYFRANSMSKVLDRVKAGGGAVIEKLAMAGGARGYTTKVSDPSGNTIGFWAPED